LIEKERPVADKPESRKLYKRPTDFIFKSVGRFFICWALKSEIDELNIVIASNCPREARRVCRYEQ
jgi:hypothetical protein